MVVQRLQESRQRIWGWPFITNFQPKVKITCTFPSNTTTGIATSTKQTQPLRWDVITSLIAVLLVTQMISMGPLDRADEAYFCLISNMLAFTHSSSPALPTVSKASVAGRCPDQRLPQSSWENFRFPLAIDQPRKRPDFCSVNRRRRTVIFLTQANKDQGPNSSSRHMPF